MTRKTKASCHRQQDIIRADVKDLFEVRRARIRGANLVANYWRTSSKNSSLKDEQRKRLSELAAEKRRVLRSLLGIEEITSEDFEPGLLNPMAEIRQLVGMMASMVLHLLSRR